MRTTVKLDSAHPTEIYEATLAYQRTSGMLVGPYPGGPTVTVGGTAMGWESPPITSAHAEAILAEMAKLRQERLQRAEGGMVPLRYEAAPARS